MPSLEIILFGKEIGTASDWEVYDDDARALLVYHDVSLNASGESLCKISEEDLKRIHSGFKIKKLILDPWSNKFYIVFSDGCNTYEYEREFALITMRLLHCELALRELVRLRRLKQSGDLSTYEAAKEGAWLAAEDLFPLIDYRQGL